MTLMDDAVMLLSIKKRRRFEQTIQTYGKLLCFDPWKDSHKIFSISCW